MLSWVIEMDLDKVGKAYDDDLGSLLSESSRTIHVSRGGGSTYRLRSVRQQTCR